MVKTDKGELRSASLVIATGGLSVPKLGASPFGYKVAEQFGLAIVAPRPGLVPLAFDAQELARYGDLSGVSVDAVVTCNGGRFRENLLFTHRGLSGPAILQISSYWTPGQPIHIDLLPERSGEAILFANRRSRALPATVLAETLPRRFAQQWCEAMGATQPIDQMSDKALRALAAGAPRLAGQALRHERLRESRGDARRRGHRRAVLEDDGGEASGGTLLHRRGGGRHRPARRVQLPVGVGVGFRRRAVHLRREGATVNRLPFTAAAVLRIAVGGKMGVGREVSGHSGLRNQGP